MADNHRDSHISPTLTETEARQAEPAGRVRYIMYVSIGAALVGMFIVYLAVF